jgi:hypothetical protein
MYHIALHAGSQRNWQSIFITKDACLGGTDTIVRTAIIATVRTLPRVIHAHDLGCPTGAPVMQSIQLANPDVGELRPAPPQNVRQGTAGIRQGSALHGLTDSKYGKTTAASFRAPIGGSSRGVAQETFGGVSQELNDELLGDSASAITTFPAANPRFWKSGLDGHQAMSCESDCPSLRSRENLCMPSTHK